MKSKLTTEELNNIWKQVPPDYYQASVSTNYLQRQWHNRKFNTFKKLLGQRSFNSILDVGCASGFMANRMSHIYQDAKIVGIDVYSEALKFGKKHYPHIQFKKADAHKLPFKANSFDLVVCYETIEHVVEPSKVISEIKRVLKKDGVAIIAMDTGSLLFRVIWWVWENTKGKVWQGAHLHPFRHKQLEKLITDSKINIQKKQFSHLGMEVSFLFSK